MQINSIKLTFQLRFTEVHLMSCPFTGPKIFGPAQNILGPVKGQGIRWTSVNLSWNVILIELICMWSLWLNTKANLKWRFKSRISFVKSEFRHFCFKISGLLLKVKVRKFQKQIEAPRPNYCYNNWNKHVVKTLTIFDLYALSFYRSQNIWTSLKYLDQPKTFWDL